MWSLNTLCILIILVANCISANNDPADPPRSPCANWMGGAPGYPGHNGLPGRDGRDGNSGEKGERGEPGVPGQKGDSGQEGLKGSQGLLGPQGPPGMKGDPTPLHRSAFSMGLAIRSSIIVNAPIRFTKVFYNEQHHYDDTIGKFRCVIPGLYQFSYHLTVYLKDVKVGLYRNNTPIMLTFDQYQTNNVDQASGSVLLHLVAGDEIWLQIYGEENVAGVYGDNINDSTFSGILLYPDKDYN